MTGLPSSDGTFKRPAKLNEWSAAGGALGNEASGELAFLLGHFCSIITALCVSPDGSLVATCDRDGKVRVSNLPPNPLLVSEPLPSSPSLPSPPPQSCLSHV